MAIEIEKIQRLREQTLASLNDVKRALDEANGDEKEALTILKKKGKIIADKKSERETNAGIVTSYIHGDGKIGVLLVLRCETDFVAKTKEFQDLAHDIALHIAAMNPLYVEDEDIPEEIMKSEKKIFEDQVKDMKKPKEVLDQIIEGKMKKYYDDVCLLNQTFVKDESKTIQDLLTEYVAKVGENIGVGKFVRFSI